jgi:hypothetical protein
MNETERLLALFLSVPLEDRRDLTVLEALGLLEAWIGFLGYSVSPADALRELILRFDTETEDPDVDGSSWEDEVAWNYRYAIGPVS